MRFSSQTLVNNGVTQRNIVRNGAVIVALDGSSVSSSKAGQIDFDYTNRTTGSLNEAQYNVVYSYFQKLSGSNLTARTMSAIMIDVSVSLGIPVVDVVAKYRSGELPAGIYGVLNALRPVGSQEELTSRIDNRKSSQFRNLNP